MAYWFSGFFARPNVAPPVVLPARACWRTIAAPFDGVGVCLPELQGERPAIQVVEGLATELGLAESQAWVYLTYTCWGGKIDSVYGIAESKHGGRIGPLEEADGKKCKETYIALMAHFGISAADAVDFRPFHRGFWGDA